MHVLFYVVAITLNMFTGDEVSRTMIDGPFKTELECTQAQFAYDFQYPKDGTVTVYNCVVIAGAFGT